MLIWLIIHSRSIPELFFGHVGYFPVGLAKMENLSWLNGMKAKDL